MYPGRAAEKPDTMENFNICAVAFVIYYKVGRIYSREIFNKEM